MVLCGRCASLVTVAFRSAEEARIRALGDRGMHDCTVVSGGEDRPTRSDAQARRARLAAYDDRMHLPIVLAAILPIVLGLSQASDDSGVAITINVVAWLVFVADLVVHMRMVRGYLKSGVGVFDLAVVVLTAPWFLIPGFGGSQVLAIARLGRLARLVVASPARAAPFSVSVRSASSRPARCCWRRGWPIRPRSPPTRGLPRSATRCGGVS